MLQLAAHLTLQPLPMLWQCEPPLHVPQLQPEWAPNFGPTAGPPQNLVLIRAINAGPTQAFKSSLFYDVGAAEFVLEFNSGDGDTRTYTAPCTQLFAPNDPLRVVAWWSYDPESVTAPAGRWTEYVTRSSRSRRPEPGVRRHDDAGG